ncbi:MAG: phosphoribosyltransferase [Flavobacteriales bacterium]|nr:phosphoribosyltransferase [Flavobacteriales bacterium]MCB9173910.1 phosphoribosyltransferase [Flavobacteriales bacterium]
MSTEKTLILNHQQITQKIDRIAYQILEDNYQEQEVVIVGIANNGYLFAEKIVEKLKKISTTDVKFILVQLTLDKSNPLKNKIELNKPTEILNNNVIILIDDVLNSGKTLIYGVKYILDYPIKRMSTAVLVDRNNKRYPIGTHYTGLALSTTLKNNISMEFEKGNFSAYLS